jgi:predicted O-methyltransferase YrrM
MEGHTGVPVSSAPDCRELFKAFKVSYERLRVDCSPQYVTDERIQSLVDDAERAIDAMKLSTGVSEEELLTQRQQARLAATTLFKRAVWLRRETKEALQQFIQAQPEFMHSKYRFTVDYSRSYSSTWPNILKHFAGKPGLNFLEVGSLEGRSACWLLDNILTDETSKLTCIDFFDDEDETEGSLLDHGRDSYHMTYQGRFKHNIILTGASHRVNVIVGRSDESLRLLPMQSFDFIFIDAEHDSVSVIQDGVLSWGLLKSHGILAFDDYCWTAPFESAALATPKPAIEAFLQLFEGHYRLLSKGYQVIVEKIR